MGFQPYIFIIYDPEADVFSTTDDLVPESGEYIAGSGAHWHMVGSAKNEAEAEQYIASLRQTYDGWGGRGTWRRTSGSTK
jgi:hypothetical protein